MRHFDHHDAIVLHGCLWALAAWVCIEVLL
jgi:hypothetical protein